jgi:hypothetical protein
LAEQVEHRSRKLCQFVEKKNAPVGKADFAWLWGVASAKEGSPRAAVVCGAKGPLMEQWPSGIELSSYGVNSGNGERLRCGEGWKQLR